MSDVVVDPNMTFDQLKIDVNGLPEVSCMEEGVVDRTRRALPNRVQDHPQWKDEHKPWGQPAYPGKSLHRNIELHYLYRTMKTLRPDACCLNLGVFRGASTAAMAHGLQDGESGKVYGVDLFDTAPLRSAYTTKQIMEIFRDRGIDKYAELCVGFSTEWAEKFGTRKFDFIFIDADHHYESTLQDFRAWSPLVADDGLLSFHDTHMDTVHRVLEEELGEWELVDHVHSIKTFKR